MKLKCKCENCDYYGTNLIYDEDKSRYFVRCTFCGRFFFIEKEVSNGEKKKED